MKRFKDSSEDHLDEEDIPLHHKRPFGAGLKRKRVEFVRASAPDESVASASKPALNVGDLYASIVLKDAATDSAPAKDEVCPVCALPLATTEGEKSRPHEVSLAHQVCVEHSHPPSALDRKRMGLRALQAQGWDPDARQGLGREGEGRMFPVREVVKRDVLGIGAKEEKGKKVERRKVLSAKEVRAEAERERRRGERLGRELFGRVDVERYLRGDGTDG